MLKGMLKESRDYYRDYKRRLIAQLLQAPYAGFLRTKVVNGIGYAYLQSRAGQGARLIETYIGRADSPFVKDIQLRYKRREKLLQELKIVKNSLKELGVKNADINSEDIAGPVRDVLEALGNAGLWDEGLELVGSWCFKLYQEYLQVEKFPLRTIDIDIAAPLPYKGKSVDIGALMKSLGLTEQMTREGIPVYEGNGIKVEFHVPLKGRGENGDRKSLEGLKLSAHALRYLDILVENPVTISVRNIGKVSIPSPAAFAVHKLLVAPTRRETGKEEKDYNQIFKVLKLIAGDADQRDEYHLIMDRLPAAWKKRAEASMLKMRDFLPLEDAEQYEKVVGKISSYLPETGTKPGFGS